MINRLRIEDIKIRPSISIRCDLCGDRMADKSLLRETGVPLFHMCEKCMQELRVICTKGGPRHKDSGIPLPVGKVCHSDSHNAGDYAYITVDNKLSFISSENVRLILKGWRKAIDPNSISAMTDVPAHVVEWLLLVWDRDMKQSSKNSTTSSKDIDDRGTTTTSSF